MNKRLLNLIALLACLFISATAYSQAVSISPATGGLASAAQIGGTNNIAVFGVQLTKAAGGGNTVTGLTIVTTPTATSKFTTARLYESTNATFDGIGSETLVVAGTINAGDITFTGSPLTNFDGATAAADDEYFFVVVDVVPTVATGSTTALSLANTGVAVSTGSATGSTITGTTYTLEPLEASFTQNGDDGSAFADEDDVVLLDFTVNSNGTQSINSTLTFTFSTDVTNILENFDLQVGGVNIGGSETYPLTSGGTVLTVTGFTGVDVTNATTFTLLADVKAGASSTNDFIVSLVPGGVTISSGNVGAFGTFSNAVDITALEADFEQTADDATATAGEADVTLLEFTVNSSGTQTLNSTLTFTFNTDVTNILENFDLQVGGVNIGGAETYPLTSGGTVLTVTGFTGVDVTNLTTFTLLADIKSGATSANDFTINLVPAGVNISPGVVEAFGTFSNAIDVSALIADFTQNADDATANPGEDDVTLMDFTVNSTGSQNLISTLRFTFNKDVTNILENFDLQVGGVNIGGSETYPLTSGGTVLTVTGFNPVDITNATTFTLLADIRATATVTDDFSLTLVPGGVNVSAGTVEAFGTFSNSIDIATSQLSDIILQGGTTVDIPYISHRQNNVTNSSPSLATFRIQDGGGTTDSDGAGTTLTSVQILITNFGRLNKLALYDGSSEIGTEQTVSGSTVNFTGLSLLASDGGFKDFTVKATFKNSVVDGEEVHVTVGTVTALANGSGFADADAGGASSSENAPTNNIDVVASTFVFTTTPSSTPRNVNFGLTIEARDNQNNLDTDFNSAVTLSKSGGSGTLSATGGETLTPNLSSGVHAWTQLQINASGTYTLTASDGEIGNASFPNFIITSTSSNITLATDPVLCYGNVTNTGNRAFKNIGNIVITETDAAGFSGTNGNTYTFSIILPSGFVFDQNITSGLALSGSDLSNASSYSYPSNNVVEFSYRLNGTANTNTITIAGLRVGHAHPGTASPPNTGVLNITRSGGSATIAGVVAGTVLGSVSANQPGANVTFTVEALPGNVAIDPGTTEFNNNSTAVNLKGSVPTGSQFFSGSGVTFSNPDYRFNPSSLALGSYPITYTHTGATGCQEVGTKTLVVYVAGISTLNASYCNNEVPSPDFTVSQTFINQRFPFEPAGTYRVDHYVYYDHTIFDFVPINPQTFTGLNTSAHTATANFDPSADVYKPVLQYFGGQIPIGFAVCSNDQNPLSPYYIPCNGNSNVGTFSTYQWVTVRVAPTVTFSMSKTSFCMGDAAVDLITTPTNSNDISVDYFKINGNNDVRLSQSPDPKVWRFSPGTTGTSGPVGTFKLTYSYVDPATLCRGTSDTTRITVNEVVPNITFSEDVCAGEPVVIENNSTLRADDTEIVTAGWNFGDQINVPQGIYTNAIPAGTVPRTSGTYQNPSHLYNSNGQFQIRATIETSDGCVYTTPPQPVDINPVPVANFTWSQICQGIEMDFNATHNLPELDIDSYNWDFSTSPATPQTGTGKTPSFMYPSSRKDTVRLIVTSTALCRDTVYKEIYVVPTYIPTTPNNSYSQNFTTNDGWIAGGVNSSWRLGTPNGTTIKGDASNDALGLAWDTNLLGQNNSNESSWVLSGCFNFAATEKPVISLDVWSDNPSGVDGAVLQYNRTGNIENDANWITIGAVGSGINWYDEQGISNNPGNQSTVSAGWSGKYPDWRTAVYRLDDLAGETNNVVLRVAFASAQPRGDGFAFDNIFVGERSRTVLLENFTNSSSASSSHVIGNYEEFPTPLATTELVKIQYHTAFPGDDPLNQLNQQMNNSRAAFYGITSAPTVRIDGSFDSSFPNTEIEEWNVDMYDDRVLTPSALKLTVTAVKTGDVVKINTTVENTSSQEIEAEEKLHIFTVIVDTLVVDMLGNSGKPRFINVAKQMLPSPAGHAITTDILPGAANAYHAEELTWDRANGTKVVVFIQKVDGSDKEVYQAAIIKPVGGSPSVVTGTEDPEYAEHVQLYPNPANQVVNIQLPAAVTKPTPVTMIDAFGRIIYESVFQTGEKTKTVSTTSFADGIYMLQLAAPQGSKVVKKVMVTHR